MAIHLGIYDAFFASQPFRSSCVLRRGSQPVRAIKFLLDNQNRKRACVISIVYNI